MQGQQNVNAKEITINNSPTFNTYAVPRGVILLTEYELMIRRNDDLKIKRTIVPMRTLIDRSSRVNP
jgi:hypothetical protein